MLYKVPTGYGRGTAGKNCYEYGSDVRLCAYLHVAALHYLERRLDHEAMLGPNLTHVKRPDNISG